MMMIIFEASQKISMLTKMKQNLLVAFVVGLYGQTQKSTDRKQRKNHGWRQSSNTFWS
jgi:hypothetical protein